MKMRLGDIRKIISEEYLRGVPEHALRGATEKYVEEIRKHVFSFILAQKSQTATDQRSAISAANKVLEELEEEVNDVLNDKLFQFSRNV